MITNEHLQEQQNLRKLYNYTKSLHKPTIFVLIDEISNVEIQKLFKITHLNMVELYKDINQNSEIKITGIEVCKLNSIIHSICGKQIVCERQPKNELKLQSKLSKPIKSVKLLYTIGINCNKGTDNRNSYVKPVMTSNETKLYVCISNKLLIYDLYTSRLIKSIILNDKFKLNTDYFIKSMWCLKHYLCFYRDTKDNVKSIKNSFHVLDTLNDFNEYIKIELDSHPCCAYSCINDCVYLLENNLISVYDIKLNLTKKSTLIELNKHGNAKCMRIFKSCFIYVLCSGVIHVYDLDLNHISEFSNLIVSASNILNEGHASLDYMFILDQYHVKIFNLIDNQYVGTLNTRSTNRTDLSMKFDALVSTHLVVDNRLYLKLSDSISLISNNFNTCKYTLSAYLIEFNYRNYFFENLFICKFNKFNYHVIENPYFITSCCKYACFKCVIENYNFLKNKFMCNFCLRQHSRFGIQKSNFLNELFYENASVIANEQLKLVRNMICPLSKYKY